MTVPKLDNYQSPLGALIEDAQEDRGISSREAALMCGVSHTAYYHWKGGALPNLSNIPVLSAFCRVPARVILAAIGLDVDETYGFGDIPGYSHPMRDNALLLVAA